MKKYLPAHHIDHCPKAQVANPAIIRIVPPHDMVFANGGNQKILRPEVRVDWYICPKLLCNNHNLPPNQSAVKVQTPPKRPRASHGRSPKCSKTSVRHVAKTQIPTAIRFRLSSSLGVTFATLLVTVKNALPIATL